MDERETVVSAARPLYGLDGQRRRPRQAPSGTDEVIELPSADPPDAAEPEPDRPDGTASLLRAPPPTVLERWTAESTERAAERRRDDTEPGWDDRFDALRSELVSELRRQIGGAVERMQATFEAEVEALRTLHREEAKRVRSSNGEALVRIRVSDTEELERIRISIDDGIGRLCGVIEGQLDRIWSANDDELERIRSVGAERLAEVHDLLARQLERIRREHQPARRRWFGGDP